MDHFNELYGNFEALICAKHLATMVTLHQPSSFTITARAMSAIYIHFGVGMRLCYALTVMSGDKRAMDKGFYYMFLFPEISFHFSHAIFSSPSLLPERSNGFRGRNAPSLRAACALCVHFALLAKGPSTLRCEICVRFTTPFGCPYRSQNRRRPRYACSHTNIDEEDAEEERGSRGRLAVLRAASLPPTYSLPSAARRTKESIVYWLANSPFPRLWITLLRTVSTFNSIIPRFLQS
ncbi:uncharacterized protein BDR25DRAFT_361383 [Lindgomyces ingoldianus]|uniref:Uncharacterized protein n=1 Tax=Lindgomyces ingoldianus TaxID=673940 RepID=A0ACB6QD61_9PLEO|nr:uncharacterized protein BDR25DRAFT_361383 [Lindgomyces ingoldianus]KAF2464543.1 hypothetical protein BDR25DRAFT_361383 [Lindgomyces ingoldianus]